MIADDFVTASERLYQLNPHEFKNALFKLSEKQGEAMATKLNEKAKKLNERKKDDKKKQLARIDYVKSALEEKVASMYQENKGKKAKKSKMVEPDVDAEEKILGEQEVNHWYSMMKDPKFAAEIDEGDMVELCSRAWKTLGKVWRELLLGKEFQRVLQTKEQ